MPGHIYFSSLTETGTGGTIYVISSDGSDLKSVVTLGPKQGFPRVSPDGKSIAFLDFSVDAEGQPHILLMNVNGTEVKRLTVDSSLGFENSPAWSPDAKRIAFITNDVYVAEIASGKLTRLTNDGPHRMESCLSWSPSGQQIAFSATDTMNSSSAANLYIVNIDGGEALNLTSDLDLDVGCPSWSPDDDRIAFSAEPDENRDIYVVQDDGAGLRRLTRQPSLETNPTWSPNGQQIAFVSDSDGYKNIYIMDNDGNGLVKLTKNLFDSVLLGWLSN